MIVIFADIACSAYNDMPIYSKYSVGLLEKLWNEGTKKILYN